MTALICGSFAFDNIMVFNDRFKNHILPDKIHILNVSFLVPEMRREFGGCAGNIAFTLNLLGGKGLPMGTVGNDFAPYAEWMDHCGIARDQMLTLNEVYTAQAYITTDLDDNQITAFHPGAMAFSHQNKVPTAQGIRFGMVSPDGREGMIEHARQFAEAGIPFIFDPGQGLPMFNGEELKQFIEQADWLAMNDYESQLLQERTGLSLSALAERVQAVIVTLGSKGSRIYTRQGQVDIPLAKASAAVDPTGCGDAYRAGLLYGLMHDMDWQTTGRMGSLLGALKVSHHGTQNHHFERDQFDQLFKENFGFDPN